MSVEKALTYSRSMRMRRDPTRNTVNDSSPGFTSLEADLAAARRHIETCEAALEESEARFRNVIERNADAIVVVGREGFVRYANGMAGRLFGVEAHTLHGTPFGFPLIAGETTEVDLIGGGTARVAEMRVVESMWDGSPVSLASLRDVTDRKRAEDDARRLIAEQAARRVAEATAAQSRLLSRASAILFASFDYELALSAFARICVQDVADWVMICVEDQTNTLQRVEVVHRDVAKERPARQLLEHPNGPSHHDALCEAVRSQAPTLVSDLTDEILDSITTDADQRALVRSLGGTSAMILPMVARSHALGAMLFVSADPNRRFDQDDLKLAQELASRAALAVDNSRLYEEARTANQVKTDFLAALSHDLRTPLNAIIGYADLLDAGVDGTLPDPCIAKVGRIRTSAAHLLYLINELLSFARLDAGHEQLVLREVDVRDVVREASDVVQQLADERSLRFVVDLSDDPLFLHTDPDRVKQILLNLVANAVKYSEDGEVRVAAAHNERGAVAISVSDTGVGIAPQNLRRIFEPFWQADRAPRTRQTGTGLGLSVVQRLVRLLGGEIYVTSSLGSGSTFTVVLEPEGRRS